MQFIKQAFQCKFHCFNMQNYLKTTLRKGLNLILYLITRKIINLATYAMIHNTLNQSESCIC